MTTLEELKHKWETQQNSPVYQPYDAATLEKIMRKRVRKHTKTSMQYFWAAFVLQVIVYSLLSHVVVKYWGAADIMYLGLFGIVLYLPFTIILMRRFKRMALAKPAAEKVAVASMYAYVLQQRTLLNSFYNFKKWYEFFLVPLSVTLAVTLIFKLYVSGGVSEHWVGAFIIWGVTLLASVTAVRAENRKSFEGPILHLQNLLNELQAEA